MENTKNVSYTKSTESVGVTETENKNNIQDFFSEIKETFGEKKEEEVLYKEYKTQKTRKLFLVDLSMYAEDEADLLRQLKKKGLIKKQTRIQETDHCEEVTQ